MDHYHKSGYDAAMRYVLMFLVGLVGCVDNTTPAPEKPEELPPCGGALGSRMVMIDRLSFIGADGDVSEGLNLDGRVSDRTDSLTCNHADFTSPDGVEGIDNQFARVIPALFGVAGEDSVLAVVQRTINSGGVLLSIEIQHLDDLEEDECVTVEVGRGEGQPIIGANGFLEEGQTYERHSEIASTRIEDARIQNGNLVAGPFRLEMPLVVDNFEIFLQIDNATVVGTFLEDGRFEGIIAGSIVIPDFIETLLEIDASAGVLQLVATALQNLADLAPNDEGECEQLSITLGFSATPGFYFDESS